MSVAPHQKKKRQRDANDNESPLALTIIKAVCCGTCIHNVPYASTNLPAERKATPSPNPKYIEVNTNETPPISSFWLGACASVCIQRIEEKQTLDENFQHLMR
ncbi:uncharacterized protein ACN2A1_008307 isoform 1-T1 [Glossina fuscipes fuscipes]